MIAVADSLRIDGTRTTVEIPGAEAMELVAKDDSFAMRAIAWKSTTCLLAVEAQDKDRSPKIVVADARRMFASFEHDDLGHE